jgi:hypothetical protein
MEIAVPLAVPDLVGKLEKHILADFTERVEEWSRCRQELTRWEEQNLLPIAPPDKLVEHKQMLERLIFFGQVFSLSASHPDFPDNDLLQDIQACLWVLREKYQMFHNPMSEEAADALLKEVFPES